MTNDRFSGAAVPSHEDGDLGRPYRNDAIPAWWWGVAYEARYMSLSQSRARRRRAQRLRIAPRRGQIARAVRSIAAEMRLRERHSAEASELTFREFVELERRRDPDAEVVHHAIAYAEYGSIWRNRARERRQAILERSCGGFRFEGGFIGGDLRRWVAPFHLDGLISEQHPILRFFSSKLPRGRRFTCSDRKDRSGWAPNCSKLLGCDQPYVDGLKTMRGFLRVEIDRDLRFGEIALICTTAGVPLPNIAVGWAADGTDRVQHPHLIWLLHDSVAFTGKGCLRFKNLFIRVLRGLTAALQPHGADPGGIFNCMRVKNPLSPFWQRRVFAEAPYTLDALRAAVDLNAVLPKPVSTPVPDHPDPTVAAGSNVMFRTLTSWANETVRDARDRDGLDLLAWRALVEDYALSLGLYLGDRHDAQRRERTLLRMAGRVAIWSWQNIRPRVGRLRLSGDEIRERQAVAGRQTAERRGMHTEDVIVATAHMLYKEGIKVTQGAVQARVQASGMTVSRRTVERHWAAVKEIFGIVREQTTDKEANI